MSSDFQKVLVKDSRLMCTDKLTYGVYKGAASMTPQRYVAISANPSSVVFNLQIPSENIVIDRRVMYFCDTTLKFEFPAGSVPAGVVPIQYGITSALAPFPNHQLCTTQSITINNNTVSMNTQDILPSLIVLQGDKRTLSRYNGMAPVMPDCYADYSDAVGTNNNPLGSFSVCSDNSKKPRGAFMVQEIYTLNAGAHAPQPISDGAAAYTVYVRFRSTEPLMLPPFIWTDCADAAGFYGIQNINMTFNLGNPKRAFRSADAWVGLATVSVDSINNATLILNQLTPHADDLLPSRNVVSYATYPRFITSVGQPLLPQITQVNGVYVYNPGEKITVPFTNIQLNQIPDKLVIWCRKSLATQTCQDADYFGVIKGISIQFNNVAGLLSTASQTDLFRYSQEAGSNQTWEMFTGVANNSPDDPTQGFNPVATSGSVLVLDFARHIGISESYYAPGSLGNFQLQFNLDLCNPFFAPHAVDQNWELVLMTVNGGLFCVERGTSSSYTGILTRADVLDVSTQEPYGNKDVERLIGSGFMDSLKSVAGKLAPKLPALAGIAKHALSMHPKTEGLSKTIGSLGYGRSGGGSSGGRRHKMEEKLLD
jgi:hypothetical protein